MNKASQSNISSTTILSESQDYISPARFKNIYSSKVQCAIICPFFHSLPKQN